MKKEKRLNIIFWGLVVVEIILDILYFVFNYYGAINYRCMWYGSINPESLPFINGIKLIVAISLLILIISMVCYVIYCLKNKLKCKKLYILILVLINPWTINIVSNLFLYYLLDTSLSDLFIKIFNLENAQVICF